MTSTAIPSAPATSAVRGPFLLAIAMIVVTTITVLWGAMTTSTGSGLAFSDWPLSDGKLMPERSYTTVPGFLEHFHRIFGALAGLLSLALVIWLITGQHGRRAALNTSIFGLVLIIVQGVIGGVGVQLGLPRETSVTHGVLAQLTLATFAWIAYQLSARYDDPPAVPGGGGRKLALFGVIMLVVQALLGGIARHTNSPHALWTHAGNSLVVFMVVVIATGFAVGRLGAIPGLRKVARSLTTLLILQVVLGFVALLIRNSAGKTPENVANLGTAALISVHVLFGAALTVLAAVLCAQVWRGTRAEA